MITLHRQTAWYR
uniref:Uncharacterized protein n=1 Tax=Anguilla anguilla TaxID=7936 RepID=A0A0E9PW95_ANGAN